MRTWLIVVATALVIAQSALSSPTTRDEKKRVVCYYGSWAVYRPGNGKFDVEQIDPFICTHIIYGFAGLREWDNVIYAMDPYNDLYENWGKGAYERFTGLKNVNPELKALLAIGGWNEGSEKYSKMARDPSRRSTFVRSVVDFLLAYNFDGLDMDWEYPAARGGIPEDKQNFVLLLQELKAAFQPHNLMLTAAVSAGEFTMVDAYDVPAVASLLDFINVMSYDYHGAWETFTGHNSPLYQHPLDTGNSTFFNMDYSIRSWIAKGAPPSKLNLGMGMYGRGFVLSNPANNGLYADAPQPLPAGPYTREAGIWGYNEICEKFQNEGGWTVVRDQYLMAPYAYKGNMWIGYDDEESIRIKSQFALSMGLGGGMLWSIETDDFRGSCHGKPYILIKTIYETLNGPYVTPPTPEPPTGTPSSTTRQTTTTTPGITRTTTAPCSTTSATGTTCPPSPICTQEGFVRDPNDCAIFYQCVSDGQGGFTMFTYSCSAGTVFDPVINSCSWPYLVPGCEGYVP